MDRRTILGTLGSVGIVALTGCLADGGESGTPENGTASDTATGTPDSTDAPAPELADSGFEITGKEGGSGTDTATVSTDDLIVTVEGVISGRNGCQTAELDSVTYNAETDELTVAVVTTRRADAGPACTQEIVAIDYVATAEFDHGTPGHVVVTHGDGETSETVTTASP